MRAPDLGEPSLLQEPISCDASLIVLVIQLRTQEVEGCVSPRLELECTFVTKRLMNKGVYGVEMMTTLNHKVYSSFRGKGREVRGTCIVIESQGY